MGTNQAPTACPPGPRERQLAGWILIAGSLLFWLSWYLMPQPGTTDAAFILAAVAAQRGKVLASAIVQTACAIALIPAALAVVRLPAQRGSRLIYAGALLLLVGAIGNGADAVYHQMAYEMTAPAVDTAAMVPVMTRMQTEDVWLLAPLMLAFFAGVVCLAIGLARAGLAPKGTWQLQVVALAVAIAGRLAVVTLHLPPRPVSLLVLALVSASLAWLGWSLRPGPDGVHATAALPQDAPSPR